MRSVNLAELPSQIQSVLSQPENRRFLAQAVARHTFSVDRALPMAEHPMSHFSGTFLHMASGEPDASLTPRTPRWNRALLAASGLSRAVKRYTEPSTAGDAWGQLGQHNLALGKPATQSSVSVRWSIGTSLEEDASRANNGLVDGSQGCHSDSEPSPWWQVDLKDVCVLREVRIFNRKERAERLRHFSILSSIDGNRWVELFRKSDDSVFGVLTLTPYVAALPHGSVGRFVRIQLHGTDVLHFNECQIFGDRLEGPEGRVREVRFAGQLEDRTRAALESGTTPDSLEDIDRELFLSQALFPFPQWELQRTIERRWILNDIPRGGVGAEIGVFRGHFSAVLLADLAPRRMYLIDPWEKLGEFFYWSDPYTNDGKLPTAFARRDSALRAARFSATDTVLIEDFFPACAAAISEPLDWIYIDASHRYEDTRAELETSAKLVKPGGYILGNDFNPDPSSADHGVFRAVSEFVAGGPHQIIAAGPQGQWCIRCSDAQPQRASPPEPAADVRPLETPDSLTGAAFRKIFTAGRNYQGDGKPDLLRDIGRVHAAGGSLFEAERVLELAGRQRADSFRILKLLDDVRAAQGAQAAAASLDRPEREHGSD
jgi:hypothetical protein